MDEQLVNYARFLASELRAMCIKGKQLYVTGNMQRSIVAVNINDNCIDVVIATDYASFTDTRGKMAGWIKQTIDRCARAYASYGQVQNDFIQGTLTQIKYGG